MSMITAEDRLRIIIAEDEPRARKGLEKQIQSMGEEYQVIGTAGNGGDALQLIRNLRPDVVFTDIRMPYIDDGIRLIQTCIDDGIDAEYVIVTAHAEFDYAQQACNMGAAGYLLKPIDDGELERMLGQLRDRISNKGRSRDKDGRERTAASALRDRYPGINGMVRKALEYMEKNYGSKFSQTDVATELGITPQYLSTVFKQETGEGFSKVLQTYRLEVARQLMDAGNTDIDDIAEKVGMESKYFSKVFRENMDMSVREYLDHLDH